LRGEGKKVYEALYWQKLKVIAPPTGRITPLKSQKKGVCCKKVLQTI